MDTDPAKGAMGREEQVILSLLDAIEKDPHTTQKDLATRLGIAVGLVNSYLKRVIYKGYVKTRNLERRRLKYLLTPSGIREKSRLTYEFLQYSYLFIRNVREKVRAALAAAAARGASRVVFYGGGEMAEIAYLGARELGMELAGVADPALEGRRCVDHVIRGAAWLEETRRGDILLVLIPLEGERRAEIRRLAERMDMECGFVL